MPAPHSTDYLYADMTYCSLCDRYFPGEEARAMHVQFATNHPQCEKCDKRFANRNSLRNHWVSSPRHHYCAACEKEFATAGGLQVHIEFAAVHRDDSDEEDDEGDVVNEEVYEDGWEDNYGRTVFPEEIDVTELTASDDESYDESDEYWDEDDESDFEDEDYHFRGFAITPIHPPVPSRPLAPGPPLTFRPPASSRTESSTSTSSSGMESNVATGCPSEASFASSSATEDGAHDDKYVPQSAVLFNCPLCLEAPKATSATRCGHVFCTPCINTALERKKACPVCREPTGQKQLRKIYLSAN